MERCMELPAMVQYGKIQGDPSLWCRCMTVGPLFHKAPQSPRYPIVRAILHNIAAPSRLPDFRGCLVT